MNQQIYHKQGEFGLVLNRKGETKMKSYNFEAKAEARIRGYVEAENEEEAKRLIRDGLWDDVIDESVDEPIWDVKITGYDNID